MPDAAASTAPPPTFAPLTGSPAIVPSIPNAAPDQPAFTRDDVVRYDEAHRGRQRTHAGRIIRGENP